MLTVQSVDPSSKADVRRFIDLPFRLYAGNRQWVPPFRRDVALALNRDAHPFYESSHAAFFVAARDGRDVGRLAALDPVPFNRHHGTRQASFYFFECEEDPEAAAALFDRAFEWARSRQMTRMVGPKGFSAFDGYGILVDGFDHRPMMTMTNYHLPHYGRLVEGCGFVKDIDFLSFHLSKRTFEMPERVRRIADRVRRQSALRVYPLDNKRQLKRIARQVGQAYNDAFVENWEYYPLSEREIDFLVGELVLVAVPRLIKLIAHGDDIVGFLFGFPDVSRALQRARGRLTPWALADLLIEMRRTTWVALNGAGILPEFQGRGGNALLYCEIERTIRESGYSEADLPQVADTAVQMRRDLAELGARPYKTHRIYTRAL